MIEVKPALQPFHGATVPDTWPDFASAPFPQPKIGVPFAIPSDPNATHTILAVSGAADARLVWRVRDGVDGPLYTLTLYDCPAGKHRQVHEGESLERLPLSVPNEQMTEMMEGSIKWFLWKAI